MRGVDAFRLRKFDEAVVAAYTAPADLSLLRPFLASLRELLDARIANFVFYRDNRADAPFGFHELETMPDYVPEMLRVQGYDLISEIKASRARSMTQAIPPSRFLQSDVYRRYYRPYGVMHHAYRDLALYNRQARLVVGRNEDDPDFDAEELDIIDRLASHLERSYGLAKPGMQAAEAFEDSFAGVAERYSLTPAELRLLHPLSTGSGLKNAADQLGITINTAKSRLRAIFEKTGTHSQAQLVRVILGDRSFRLPN